MLRSFAVVAAVLAFTAFGAAPAPAAEPARDPACVQRLFSSPPERSGCCSYHNGVCGCNSSTGMQRCCDGSDSPSCRCGE